MPHYLLAHDLGTSGNKATLYDEAGRLVASRTVSYPTRYFNGNWAEQEPADWWHAVCLSTQALLAEVRAAEIAVVALSGQMMGCTVVDRRGRTAPPFDPVLRPAGHAAGGADPGPDRPEEFLRHRRASRQCFLLAGEADVDSRQRAGDLRPHPPHAVREGLHQLSSYRPHGHRLLRRLGHQRLRPEYVPAGRSGSSAWRAWRGRCFPRRWTRRQVLGEITAEAAGGDRP